MLKIVIGSDHVGVQLKKSLIEYLRAKSVFVKDIGPYCEDKPVDYPEYAEKTAWQVVSGEFDYGIVICGTGIGVSIAANKVPGALAALCNDTYAAHQARSHNDANILAMGAWVVTPQLAFEIIDEWLDTHFEEGRHVIRVERLKRGFVVGDKTNYNILSHIRNQDIQMGVSLSIRESSFGPLLFRGQLEEGMKNASHYGFDLIEISVRWPKDVHHEELEKLIERYDLRISAIASGQGCIHDDLCLCAEDEEVRLLAVQRMKDLADHAANLKADLIIGGVRGRFQGSEERKIHQRKGAVEAIKKVVQYASKKNVTILLEPINRYETNFINTVTEGLQFIEHFGESNIKLLVDTFHMNIEESDMCASIRKAAQLIGCVHFADSNRCAPGQGHIDFDSILCALAEINYCGPIVCEILPLPDDASAMRLASEQFCLGLVAENV